MLISLATEPPNWRIPNRSWENSFSVLGIMCEVIGAHRSCHSVCCSNSRTFLLSIPYLTASTGLCAPEICSKYAFVYIAFITVYPAITKHTTRSFSQIIGKEHPTRKYQSLPAGIIFSMTKLPLKTKKTRPSSTSESKTSLLVSHGPVTPSRPAIIKSSSEQEIRTSQRRSVKSRKLQESDTLRMNIEPLFY